MHVCVHTHRYRHIHYLHKRRQGQRAPLEDSSLKSRAQSAGVAKSTLEFRPSGKIFILSIKFLFWNCSRWNGSQIPIWISARIRVCVCVCVCMYVPRHAASLIQHALNPLALQRLLDSSRQTNVDSFPSLVIFWHCIDTPDLPTNIVPTSIAWLKLSGKSPMGLGNPPLEFKIVLESNHLKPTMIVGRLGVNPFQAR